MSDGGGGGETVSVPVRAGGGERDYRVLVRRGLLDEVGEHAVAATPDVARWAIISDETVADLYGERVQRSLAAAGAGPTPLFTFPPGEEHKNRRAWAGLTDALLAEGLGRDAGIVALGGGVTGDLAGFVAATFLRGIPVVQVPTSVVAMVDSAVGGKTGVDTPAGKNLVGAFHPPAVVVVDPEAVGTLARLERSQGLAEAVKHGAIADPDHLDFLEERAGQLLDGDPEAVREMAIRSIAFKADIVTRDEREGGLRKILNFGHTLGHALEAASGFGMGHGSAVAVGMVLEARLGARLGVTRDDVARRLATLLDALELPVCVPGGMDPEEILRYTATDKKARGGEVRYVLLSRLGEVARGDGWTRGVPAEELRGLLSAAVPGTSSSAPESA
jgi:3-dehydroquinate synthase